MNFALPEWLLHPTGPTAAVLVLMYFGGFVWICYYVYNYFTRANIEAAAKEQSMSVARSDILYLQKNLTNNSTHIDILYWIATTPENLETAKNNMVSNESRFPPPR